MIVIGIDPGLTGGIAILKGGHIAKDDLHVMPDTLGEFVDILLPYSGAYLHVFIERCQPMPKQGISSAFNYGRHFGELIGVITKSESPYTLVPANKWTKVMHASTKKGMPKQRSLEAVKRLYPSTNLLASPRCKKPHEGLVDALLIATYGAAQLMANQ